MNFFYNDEQQSIIDLAFQILRDGTSQERLREIEAQDGPRFDRELWSQVAEAGLLGIAVPEEQGGAGLGFLEVAAVIEQLGRTVAPIPLLETTVLGILPLIEFGDAAQQERWLPAAASGEAILTSALNEGTGATLYPTETVAAPDSDGWRITGSKICVPAAEIADLVLLPASTGSGKVGVFLVDPKADGVTLTPLITTSGQPEARMDLLNVVVAVDAVLGRPDQGAAITEWISERANAALANLSLGVCEAALELTKEYAKTRKQFDQPIAMFQAVGHRAADAYIDTEGVRLTALQATWRISEGLPATKEVAVAKHWACEAGSRVVHAAVHLHGGIGVDKEYPLHRYFTYARHLELTLGGSTQQLLKLGAVLADEAA